jgi:tetratricopeptide (TPR) repeat protein
MNGQQFAEQLQTRAGVAVILAVLVMVQVVLYLPTLKYQFVWDDRPLIVENRALAAAKPGALFTRQFWAETEEAPRSRHAAYYRPVTTLSFWLDLKVAGANPAYFHFVNIVLAALATVMVMLTVWELLHSGVWSGLAGLLFATHPAHTESIAFVSGRTDLLLTVFVAGAGFGLLRSFRKKDRRWWLVVVPLFVLGLLSKETAILFPILAGLTPVLIQSRPLKGYWLLVAVLFLVTGGYLVARLQLFGQAVPAPGGLGGPELANVVNAFGYYIRMFFWPFEHRAKIPPDPAFYRPQSFFLFALIFFFSVPLAALKPRFRIALWGYVWAIIFLIPVSNIIPFGPQPAERLLYCGSAGLVAVVIVILSRLLVAYHRSRQVAGALLVVVAGLFGFDSFKRMPVWQNELTLFSAMVREAPGAPSAYAYLARALRSFNPDSAIKLYNRAIILDQGFVSAHLNVAILYAQKGDWRRALHHLRLAEELAPEMVQIQNQFGYTFLLAGEPDSAEARFTRALELDSTLTPARLGRALSIGLTGRTGEAGALIQALVAVEPVWQDTGRQMVSELFKVFALDTSFQTAPRRAVYINRLGSMLLALGDTLQAEGFYRRALEVDENCVPALYHLAVLSLNRGDRLTARRLIGRALKLRPDIVELQRLKAALQPK